jgi:beta-lactamase superfamily II metal-dependent hydrolase
MALSFIALALAASIQADAATNKDIKDAEKRIQLLQNEINTLAQPLSVSNTEIRVGLQRSLFVALNQALQAMPPGSRSEQISILSGSGTMSTDSIQHGFPFGCGFDLKLHRLVSPTPGIITLDQIAWSAPGQLAVDGHVSAAVVGDVGLNLHGFPCPDLVCGVDWFDATIGTICDPLGLIGCVDIKVRLPRPHCEFRGWTDCQAGCSGGGFELPVAIPLRGKIDTPVRAIFKPESILAADHAVARVIGLHPGVTAAEIAERLSLTNGDVTAGLGRLQSAGVVDSTGALTSSGKEFAAGTGTGMKLVTTIAPSKAEVSIDITVPLPEPSRSLRWLCSYLPNQIQPVCDVLDQFGNLIDPIYDWLFAHDISVNINDLIRTANANGAKIDLPTIDIPSPLPSAVSLSGSGDNAIQDPVGPPANYKLPTSNRPVRAEGYATSLQVDGMGLMANGATNIGWMDIESWIDKLQVHFIDVGQGDAILMRLPRKVSGERGDFILIDGGPDTDLGGMYAEYNRLLLYLRFFNVPQDSIVDTVVVTHPHRDHFVGLIELLKNVHVRRMVISSRCGFDLEYFRLLHTARERGVQLVTVDSSAIVETSSGVKIQAFQPVGRGVSGMGYFETRTSNESIITKITYLQHSLLLMGDALGRRQWFTALREPDYVENALLNMGSAIVLPSSILKIGDHASERVGSPAFLRGVDPAVVIAMAGRERKRGRYTPDPETVLRIKRELPSATFVTTAEDDQGLNMASDYDGDDIFLGSDGKHMYVYQAVPIPGQPGRQWKLVREILPH